MVRRVHFDRLCLLGIATHELVVLAGLSRLPQTHRLQLVHHRLLHKRLCRLLGVARSITSVLATVVVRLSIPRLQRR